MKPKETVERLAKNPHYIMSNQEKQILSEVNNDILNAPPQPNAKKEKSVKDKVKTEAPRVEFIEPVANRNRVVRETGAIKKHTTTTIEE